MFPITANEIKIKLSLLLSPVGFNEKKWCQFIVRQKMNRVNKGRKNNYLDVIRTLLMSSNRCGKKQASARKANSGILSTEDDDDDDDERIWTIYRFPNVLFCFLDYINLVLYNRWVVRDRDDDAMRNNNRYLSLSRARVVYACTYHRYIESIVFFSMNVMHQYHHDEDDDDDSR